MKTEKIFKRECGARVSIAVTLTSDHSGTSCSYTVSTCEKGKRKFIPVIDTNQHCFRKLSHNERIEFAQQQYLLHVTKEEIIEAREEAFFFLQVKFTKNTNANF